MKNIVHVVIVDDQQPARMGLRSLLSLVPSIEVVGEASNGCKAVKLVAEKQPNVVLMDIEMPVMDGLAATKAIKQQWPQVRIVVITLHSKYRTLAIAAGADDFLVKGTDSERLLNAIIGAENLNGNGQAANLP